MNIVLNILLILSAISIWYLVKKKRNLTYLCRIANLYGVSPEVVEMLAEQYQSPEDVKTALEKYSKTHQVKNQIGFNIYD